MSIKLISIFIFLFLGISQINSKPISKHKGTESTEGDESERTKDGIPPYAPGQVCSSAETPSTWATACIPPPPKPPPPPSSPPSTTKPPPSTSPSTTKPPPSTSPSTTQPPPPPSTSSSTPPPSSSPSTTSHAYVEISSDGSTVWKAIRKHLQTLKNRFN